MATTFIYKGVLDLFRFSGRLKSKVIPFPENMEVEIGYVREGIVGWQVKI